MKLNLGSGINGFDASGIVTHGNIEGWKNIDICEHYNAHEHYDISNGIKESDNSIEMIWMGDVLEHIYRWKTRFVLQECFRVLQSNGSLLVSVPDMNKVMPLWLESEGTDDGHSCLIWGQQDELNGRNSGPDSHFNGFTEKSLRILLENVGFRNIEKTSVHGVWFELAMRAVK